MTVFFSLLSVFIVILLYALFLKKMQIDWIRQTSELTPTLEAMVNEWFTAGLLSMLAISTTLGAFGMAIQDLESKAMGDFLVAPISRATIHMSYVVNAFLVGCFFTFSALAMCEIYIVLSGGELLSFFSLLKVSAVILLSLLLASVMNAFFVLFIHSQSAFAALSTIVGTLLGFLCGVYVPIGMLPSFAQKIIMYFPSSHTTVLLRNAFMEHSLEKVFKNAPPEMIESYKLLYGITYKINDYTVSTFMSYTIILSSTILLSLLTIALFTHKHK